MLIVTFFFIYTSTTEIYTLSLHDALPICMASKRPIHDEVSLIETSDAIWQGLGESGWLEAFRSHPRIGESHAEKTAAPQRSEEHTSEPSHLGISYAVFCLKKKKKKTHGLI